MHMRSVAVVCALAILAGCSGKMGQSGLTPTVSNDIAATAAHNAAQGKGALVMRIKMPRRDDRRPNYISPATQGISVAITGPVNVTQSAGLVANAKGCQSSLMTVECTLTIPSLTACPSAGNCYTGSVTTYNKFDSASNKIPRGAKKLSADLAFHFSIKSGNTTVPVVLQGIVKSIAFLPGPTSSLTGNMKSGFIFPKCSAKNEDVSIVAVDSDKNYILGVGAPQIAVASDNKTQLGVVKSKIATPNSFTLSPPKSPNYAYGNATTHLTVTATPGTGSGQTAQSTIVAITYSGDICGKFTEFPIPTAASRAYGITTGPDGNLWFTEEIGNKVGRITTAGVITEFPVPTAGGDPAGIVTGPDGNLWFAEAGASKIGRMSTNGSAVEFATTTANAGPIEITAGPDGNLWATENTVNNLAKVTPTGTVTEYPVLTAGSGPYGITSGPNGNLWFTEINGNNIGTSTTAGAVTEYPISTPGSKPPGIVTGSDGALWFVECQGNAVGRITTAGSITSQFPTPDLSPTLPVFITEGPDGNVWFSEAGVNKIGSSTVAGLITEFAIPSGSAEPFHVTQGPDGAIWFVEEGANKVGRLR
jgi:virginiamycin B lyase